MGKNNEQRCYKMRKNGNSDRVTLEFFHTENRRQMEKSTSRSCRCTKPERLQKNRVDLFMRDYMYSLEEPPTSIRSGN